MQHIVRDYCIVRLHPLHSFIDCSNSPAAQSIVVPSAAFDALKQYGAEISTRHRHDGTCLAPLRPSPLVSRVLSRSSLGTLLLWDSNRARIQGSPRERHPEQTPGIPHSPPIGDSVPFQGKSCIGSSREEPKNKKYRTPFK